MPDRTKVRIAIAVLVGVALLGLLYWQDQRYRLVGECVSRGWQWDGSRCRPARPIYIDRGLRRT